MPPLLEVEHLQAGYGPLTILRDLSLAIAEGGLTSIVGPNGAGKTTLLRAIMGMVPSTRGEIRFSGRSIRAASTWSIVRDGLVLIPEGRMIFRGLSVEDNLVIGAFGKRARARMRANLDAVYGLFPRLRQRRTQDAGSLSGGEAQMLAIGRGLMEEPRLMLVDEPCLGLAPVVVDEIVGILARLRGEGRTIVLVEQNTRAAVALADRVVLMTAGRIALIQDAGKVDVDRLHDVYFGRTRPTSKEEPG